jgi:ABC-type enterochelin transport system permease subunit
MFAKWLQTQTWLFHVCLSTWNNLVQNEEIFMMLYVGFLLKSIDSGTMGYLSRKIKFMYQVQFWFRPDKSKILYVKMYDILWVENT